MIAALSVSTHHPAKQDQRAAVRAACAAVEGEIDRALVRRFNAGDEKAFDEIFGRYRERMYQLAFRLLRSHADAEEVAQDAFIRAHRGLAHFRGECSLPSWLYRVTQNLSYNRYAWLRRRGHLLSVSLDAAKSEGGAMTLAETVACPSPGPVRMVTSREFAVIVQDSTAVLSANHRKILTLCNEEERSYAHIGRALGLKRGTVKSRIARARCSLRALVVRACADRTPEVPPLAYFEALRSPGRWCAASG